MPITINLTMETMGQLKLLRQSTLNYIDHQSKLWAANNVIFREGECTLGEFTNAQNSISARVSDAEGRLTAIENEITTREEADRTFHEEIANPEPPEVIPFPWDV